MHFDAWLKGHHLASKGTRDGYRAAGERRLKPFFDPMRLSAIDVQTVRTFGAEMVELVEVGELAPKAVNNTLSWGTCLKDAAAGGEPGASRLPSRGTSPAFVAAGVAASLR